MSKTVAVPGQNKRAFSFRKGHDTYTFLLKYAGAYHQGNVSAALSSLLDQFRRTKEGKAIEASLPKEDE